MSQFANFKCSWQRVNIPHVEVWILKMCFTLRRIQGILNFLYYHPYHHPLHGCYTHSYLIINNLSAWKDYILRRKGSVHWKNDFNNARNCLRSTTLFYPIITSKVCLHIFSLLQHSSSTRTRDSRALQHTILCKFQRKLFAISALISLQKYNPLWQGRTRKRSALNRIHKHIDFRAITGRKKLCIPLPVTRHWKLQL